MSDFVSLSCPSCGAKLEITNDIEKFACIHCGNEHVVKRSGGIVTLHPLMEEIKKISHGIDATANELMLSRIENEIRELKPKKEAYETSIISNLVVTLLIMIAIAIIIIYQRAECILGAIVVIGPTVYFILRGRKAQASAIDRKNKKIDKRLSELKSEKERLIEKNKV